MIHKTSHISSWYRKNLAEERIISPFSTIKKMIAPLHINAEKLHHKKFSPIDFLTPEWKATDLLSKSAGFTIKFHRDLCKDAKKQFLNFHMANRSIKMSIFKEFLLYSKTVKNLPNELIDISYFWKCLSNSKNYQEIKEINDFISIYSFRVATIYLLKFRFIFLLSKNIDHTLKRSTLLNPTSFLSKIFKRNSSSELLCESLQTSQYSWFRPSVISHFNIDYLSKNLTELSLPEIIKICTFKQNDRISRSSNVGHCHALSQETFGHFLLKLILKQEKDTTKKCSFKMAKFTGHYLDSLAISHWISQKSYLNDHREQDDTLILPIFHNDTFHHGQYFKFFHELLHLSFLVDVSVIKKISSIQLICAAMKSKYEHSTHKYEQMPILLKEDHEKNIKYEHLILNLTNFPSKNPHHFLLNQIQLYGDSLYSQGQMIVLSNQKLFIPSHVEKIEQLINTFKVDMIFNFETLHGKGEIPSYIYVLTKRNFLFNSQNDKMLPSTRREKEACLKFNWSGTLTSFNKLDLFIHEFHSFMHQRKSSPIYHKKLTSHLSFSYHQDAIIEGRLLSNHSSMQKNNLMHPQFFNNLIKTCIPFDYFFYLYKLDDQKDGLKETSHLFDFNMIKKEKYSTILIVNTSNLHHIKIELTTFDAYEEKVHKYGHAFFQYYSMLPKKTLIDINLFKALFSSELGSQIIQFSLNGSLKKLKSKLKTMLIPKFFFENTQISPLNLEKLKIFHIDQRELIKGDLRELFQQFQESFQSIHEIEKQYPSHTISILFYFSNLLRSCLSIKNNIEKEDRYSNHIAFQFLKTLQTYPILPYNPDLYAKMIHDEIDHLNYLITSTTLRKDKNNYSLSLFFQEEELATFYGEFDLLDLIRFILEQSEPLPLSRILQDLQIPKIADLVAVLKKITKTDECFRTMIDQATLKIDQVLLDQILAQRI